MCNRKTHQTNTTCVTGPFSPFADDRSNISKLDLRYMRIQRSFPATTRDLSFASTRGSEPSHVPPTSTWHSRANEQEQGEHRTRLGERRPISASHPGALPMPNWSERGFLHARGISSVRVQGAWRGRVPVMEFVEAHVPSESFWASGRPVGAEQSGRVWDLAGAGTLGVVCELTDRLSRRNLRVLVVGVPGREPRLSHRLVSEMTSQAQSRALYIIMKNKTEECVPHPICW